MFKSRITNIFIAFFTFYFSPGNITAAEEVNAQDSRSKIVYLRGELATRYSAATANLLCRQDRYTMNSFIASAEEKPGALWWDWPGDQVGRWFSVLHVAGKNGWTTAGSWRRQAAEAALPLQNQKGAFGREVEYDHANAQSVSGNAFALRGLMDAYQDTGESRYLEGAKRLRDYFEKTWPYWRDKSDGNVHEFWGHCLDGLVKLYQLGNDREALALAQRIHANLGRGHHTHHSLSMYRGAIELFKVTQDQAGLEPVRDFLHWCRENRLASGGVPESMPESPQDEGCALADYVIVNLMMFEATAEEIFLTDAEHVLVNHFFMNQFHTGGFGHRKLSKEIVGGKEWQGWDGIYGSENPGCCSLWGSWALGQVGEYVITPVQGGYNVNLYAQVEVLFPQSRLGFTIDSDFPRCSTASITISCCQPQPFCLYLRVPEWAADAVVDVNGQLVKTQRDKNNRLAIERLWAVGDMITIHLTSPVRCIPWPASQGKLVSLMNGPLCLALSSADAEVDKNWSILLKDGQPVRNQSGFFQLTNGEQISFLPLKPVADDWLSSSLKEPNRLRILFGLETK